MLTDSLVKRYLPDATLTDSLEMWTALPWASGGNGKWSYGSLPAVFAAIAARRAGAAQATSAL
jgi:hypothetical protein